MPCLRGQWMSQLNEAPIRQTIGSVGGGLLHSRNELSELHVLTVFPTRLTSTHNFDVQNEQDSGRQLSLKLGESICRSHTHPPRITHMRAA
jgi:hypothetical protein